MTPAPSKPITRGILWMLLAVLSFCMLAISVRNLKGFSPFEINFYRCLLALPMIFLVIKSIGGPIKSKALLRHGARNVSHFGGQILWYVALPLLPLAQVFALEFTTPLWVILFAALFLGEKVTRHGLIAALIGFIGVMFVAQPFSGTLSVGVIAAALSAVGFAGSIILTKRLTRTETVTQIIFYMCLMQGAASLVIAGYDGQMTIPAGRDWLWFAVAAIFGLVGHGSLTKALSLAPATVVSPVDYLRLPLSAVLGLVLYNETLAWPVIVGAVLIVGGNYFNILGNQKRAS